MAESRDTRQPDTISVPNAGKDALLSPLRISLPESPSDCRTPCSVMRSEAHADAIVFVLHHQPNRGLVRLTDNACRQRTSAKLLRNGDPLVFPIAGEASSTQTTHEVVEWQLQPNDETFYVLAMTNADLARQMANHIDKLPLRCSSSSRIGLSGVNLGNWLTEFALLAARSSGSFDWRAIQVRDAT